MDYMNRKEREVYEQARLRKVLHDRIDKLEGQELYDADKILKNMTELRSFMRLIERLRF